MIPIIILDFIGLIFWRWGTQFYITCIEQLVLSLLIIILTIIEVKTGKIYDYNALNGDDAFAIPQD
jgi:hypothetical protein